MQRKTQLIVTVPDKPGALAMICDAVADLNIAAMACTGPYRGQAIFHILVDDPKAAYQRLSPIGAVSEMDVLVFNVVNRPGVIRDLSKACAEAGVNQRSIYASSGPEGVPTAVVLGVDDIEKAKQACADLELK